MKLFTKSVLLFTLSTAFFLSTNYGQSINLISNPSGSDAGFQGNPIIYESNLYFQYQNSSGKNQLAKYDGTAISLISNLSGSDGGFQGNPIIYGSNLYFQYQNSSGKNQLAIYDGTTLSLISNLSVSDPGFQGNPIIYGSNLYFQYQNSSGQNQLAKYDGTTLSLISNLSVSDAGFQSNPIIYGSNLYFSYQNSSGQRQLAKYDGTTLSLISNPSASDGGFYNYPIVYGSNLYFQYNLSSSYYQLAKYDGTTISLISNPSGSDFGFFGSPIVYGSNLYFQYQNVSGKMLLAKYDGTTLNLISNLLVADNGYLGTPIVYNSNLYFQYSLASGKRELAKYDGTNPISLISNLSGSDQGFQGSPIVYGNNLYFQYQNSSNKFQLAKYDGTTLSLISNPSGSDQGFRFSPVVYGSNLYFGYINSSFKKLLAQLIFPTWTGTTNTAWNTNTNWSTGTIPTSTDSVTIPFTTNKPTISVAGAVANEIIIQSGGILTLSGSGTLTVGTGIAVNAGGALVGSSSNITGTVTLQQSIIAQRGWRMFANPFSTTQTFASLSSSNNVTINTSAGPAGIADTRVFSNSSNAWADAGTSTAANTAYGLFIRGIKSDISGGGTGLTYAAGPTAFTYGVSGTLNASSFTVPSANVSNFSLVGNPYAAPVNSQALTGGSAQSYYLYQIAVSGNGQTKAGSWSTVLTSNITSPIPVLGVIALKTAGNYSVATSDINITNAATGGLFGIETPIPHIELQVEQNGNYQDKMFVRLDPAATAKGTDKIDLEKFYNDNVNVYSLTTADNSRLAVDARNVLSIIPLGISALAGDYNFKLSSNNLPEGTIVYLKDKLLNTQTELKVGGTYNFSITSDAATYGEQRFELSFSTKATATANDPSGSLAANVLGNITSGNQVAVQVAGSSGLVTIAIKDMNGKSLGTMNAVNGIQYVNVGNAAKGMLLLQISDGKSSIIKKVMKL